MHGGVNSHAEQRWLNMNRKGQFPIILGLALSAILIVSALVAYKVSIFPRKAEQGKWIHIIINLDEDLQRALKAALANFTQEYMETGNLTVSKRSAEIKLKAWKLAFIVAHIGSSVKLNLNPEGVTVRSEFSYSVNLTYNQYTIEKVLTVPNVAIERGSFFTCSWDSPCGVSAAYASVALDVTQDKVYGWNSSSLIFLALNITSINSDSSLNETRIGFTCHSEKGWINQLNSEDVAVYINSTEINVVCFEYEGEGRYTVTIGRALSPPYTLRLCVRDNRGIFVNASLQD